MFYWKNNTSEKPANISMARLSFALAVISVAYLTSCKQKENATAKYYPLDSLINSQVLFLRDAKATLTKYALLDQKTDTTSYIPSDSTAWSNELGVLTQLSVINKPIYSDKYTVRDGLQDLKSNLKIRYYE